MLQLTEDCWKNFKKDGKLFEELVGDLLALEYPGKTFRQTQPTHDGSRDWELKIPLLYGLNADIWFECKDHKEPLSANEVAMTLVMAYIEEAKQIVFFSYSPVNREFTKKISRFSDRSKIPVYIYADTSLEALILRHWDKLNTKHYFNMSSSEKEQKLSSKMSVYCEVYQNGQLISCHKKEDLPVVHFNDILMIRLTLFNNSSFEDQSVTLSIVSSKETHFTFCDEEFISENYQKTIFVPHNGICSFSLFLKLKQFGKIIHLPSVKVCWKNGQKTVHPGNIEGQWLADASLIGQEFQDIVLTQGQCMRSHTFTVSQISGHSGVGKSRLIHEVMTQAHILGKQVFHIDNDLKKVSFPSLVRQLISCLEGLPELPTNKTLHILENNNKTRPMTIQILYHDKYLSKLSIETLAKYLFQLIQNGGLWIVLDNVQWMDEDSIRLLNLLLTYAGTPSNSGIFMSFNNDYLFHGTKAEQLLKSVQAYSAQYPQNFKSVELAGFSYIDALNYLQECLTYKTESVSDELEYKETLKKVIDHCGTQPFYLQNMLIYLCQTHVLERTENTSFYLTSISDFWNKVKEIPKSVLALLERRIQLTEKYLEKKDEKEIFLKLCTILSFCDSIPNILSRELFGSFSIKRELVDLGILSIDASGNLLFYHQYFEKYFQHVCPLEQISQELLEDFCAAIEKRHLEKNMLEAYYLAKYTLGTCEQALLQKVMKKLIDWQVPPRLSSSVKLAVAAQLENCSEEIPDRLVASCYYEMCFMTANREGMKEACNFYEKCFQDLLAEDKAYTKNRDIIFPLIREYLLSLGNLNCNKCAIEHAEKLLAHYYSEAEYCTIREILCISNYAMGQVSQAVIEVKDALQHCTTNEDILKLTHEYGKSYYFAPDAFQYQKQICEHWDNAFDFYRKHWNKPENNHNLSCLQREIAAWLNAGISNLIQGKIMEAEEKRKYLFQYLDRTRMPFYEIKLRLFGALVLIMSDMGCVISEQSYKEICRLLDNATDICVVYYNMQDYPLCFYLRAVTQLYAGRYDEALDSYKKTCTVLQKYINSEQEESIWSYFYEDMVLRFVQLHQEFPEDLLKQIYSKELRKRVQILGKCDAPEEEIYRCDRSPILYGKGPWGLPKI